MRDRTLNPARMTVPATPRGRGCPPRPAATGLRERAWWLIRHLGKPFTIDDLLFTLNDSGARDAPNNLGRYLRQLQRAGVLVRLQRRAPGRALQSTGLVIWRLAQDLGPEAPVWRRDGSGLWDPNASQLLPCQVEDTQAGSMADAHDCTATVAA